MSDRAMEGSKDGRLRGQSSTPSGSGALGGTMQAAPKPLNGS